MWCHTGLVVGNGSTYTVPMDTAGSCAAAMVVTNTAERKHFPVVFMSLLLEKTLDAGIHGVKPTAMLRPYFFTNLCNPMELTPAA